MAIRSREELTLADLFAHTLGNLIALTGPEEPRAVPTSAQILEAPDNELCIPPALFRLVQLVLLPEALGANSGAILYVAAKRFSGSLELRSIQDLKSWFAAMMLGELEVELDEEKVLVKLSKCMTCYRLPATGSALCDFERGLVDGVLERITGADVITKETLCWGLGDTVCQFEAYNSEADGYVYAEDGSQREVQRRLLAGLADQSDIALENLLLVGDHRYAETRDALTGMFNFRHLREHAAVELARARRHERTVAFVMLDIDGFAKVNEAVGQAGGDVVLRQWADQLRALLRECDLTCRYGADEFLLVLPETGDAQADHVLGRLHAALGEMLCEVEGRSFALSASAGVATFPEDGAIVEELVAKATTTMYVAKSRGDAQIGFFSPPVQEPVQEPEQQPEQQPEQPVE
jgi:diguanylate cyclase (GGDEF)-like protein